MVSIFVTFFIVGFVVGFAVALLGGVGFVREARAAGFSEGYQRGVTEAVNEAEIVVQRVRQEVLS